MKLILIVFLFLSFLVFPKSAFAQTKDIYFKGTVVEIIEEGAVIHDNTKNLYQDLKVKLDNGKTVQIHYGDPITLKPEGKLINGDSLVILQTQNPEGKTTYLIYDKYRFNTVLIILALFVVLIIATAGLRGIGSIIGLGTSLAVILFFIVPQILAGHDPLLISIIGSLIILFVSTYIAHGISKKTTVALVSTFIALFITAAIAVMFTTLSKLTGIGDEDIAALQIGATSIINLKGLFLAGVIIGTLGALNDITITQAATLFEMAKMDKTIKFQKLIKNGFSVGREHILSLVNTLILAYAGTSLFIFIFLILNPAKVPYWVILNTETISGEIISTVAGSTGLILAVPIATILSAWVIVNLVQKKNL